MLSRTWNLKLTSIKFFHSPLHFVLVESERTSIDGRTTMKAYPRLLVILYVVGSLLVASESLRCSKDSDCTDPGEICCKRDFTCNTKRRCHVCIIHSHCPAGKQCVNSLCVRSSYISKSCYSDDDCLNDTSMAQNLKCCNGKCEDIFRCRVITSTTTATVAVTRSSSLCGSWRDCPSGEQCEGGKCKKSSDVMLTKAGFLSAAILTGSVFLLILCCCFVRESRYSRQRYAERQRRRSRNRRRSRQSRRRSTHSTIAVENRAFSTEDCRDCEGGFYIPPPEYPSELTNPDVILSPQPAEQSSPPPYHTLSFELPPSYDEAVQTE